MQYLLSILWLVLAWTWISGVMFLGHTVGGVEWLVHTGRGIPAAMNVLMAAICVVAAIDLSVTKKLRRSIVISAAVVILIHLVNALGMYLIYESSGRTFRSDSWLMVPFRLLSMVLPTNTLFTEQLSGNHVFLILPIASVTLLAVSVLINTFRKSQVEPAQ